jgi:hypothetical protein
VILGPVSKTGQGAGMLLFDLGLTTETLVAFPTSVLSVVPFPESGVLGTGNLDPFLAAFEDTGTPRYQSATLAGDWLSSGYELPLARADGSSCMVGDPGVSFVDEGRPSMLACTNASGALLFQVSISPILQPQAPMELEDAGIVVMDVRSPHLRVVEPDGTARVDLTTCIPPELNDPLPYFKGANAARTPDGGGVAQVGDDLISFAADGTLRWRSAIPFGDSTPLVAADGTIYALTQPAVLVALEPTGEVRWTLPVGNSGELIGLAEDGTIYVGSGFWYDYGLLLAVSPEGSITWSALSTTTGWVLAPDGNLYAYTRGEEPALESVRGDSPLASAGWPAPRGDARAAGTR